MTPCPVGLAPQPGPGARRFGPCAPHAVWAARLGGDPDAQCCSVRAPRPQFTWSLDSRDPFDDEVPGFFAACALHTGGPGAGQLPAVDEFPWWKLSGVLMVGSSEVQQPVLMRTMNPGLHPGDNPLQRRAPLHHAAPRSSRPHRCAQRRQRGGGPSPTREHRSVESIRVHDLSLAHGAPILSR